MEILHVTHEFPPLFDAHCTCLLLGSIPSRASRQQAFYYAHPQNRFWRVMAAVFDAPVPGNVTEKRRLMLAHHVALWDALEECDIRGSSDSTVRNPVPTDIPWLLTQAPIRRVYTCGAAADRYYRLFNEARTGIEACRLPSTSPANCAVSMEELIAAYRVLKEEAP